MKLRRIRALGREDFVLRVLRSSLYCKKLQVPQTLNLPLARPLSDPRALKKLHTLSPDSLRS